MAGTSAAHFLRRRGYDVTIVEKNDRLGGRMKSKLTDGIVLEQGAGFVMDIYANTLRFLRESGLHKDLCRNPHASAGIVRGGKVRFLGLRTIFGTTLLSWKAKWKGFLFLAKVLRNWRSIDIHHPWKLARYDDVSIGDYRATPEGAELFDYFIQPALTGTWYWPPEDVAQTSEGLLLVAGKAVLTRGTYTMRGGLQRIPEKAAEGSTVLLEHTATQVDRRPNGSYEVTVTHDDNERVLHADGIVCATTATVAAKLFPNLPPERKTFIDSIRYSSTTYVGRTFRKEDLPGSRGIVFPSSEGSPVAGSTSVRGKRVGWVKVYGVGKELRGKDNATIFKTLTDGSRHVEKDIFRPGATPLSSFIWHRDEALPTAEKGYFRKLERFIEEEETTSEPLVFAGDYIGGAFIEGAFTSGMQAAGRLHNVLSVDRKP
ncbi:MAG: hypothetical protein QOE22_489 [Candidatus Parcubacteria bacterium]|nr:hypothetical protein [Candidatus Parcubacteria bacterium]